MPHCPSHHESQWSDYCDVCGAPMTGASSSGLAAGACPLCGEVREGRFCEQCGYDFDAPRPAARAPSGPPAWVAVVTADRGYFETGGESSRSFTFPASCPQRRVALTGRRVRIGRRSTSRAFTPEIDLSCPPEDPGVSHEHAQLLAQPDGSWALVDRGSTNGTYLNGSPDPVPSNLLVPLAADDRIHVGVWTTITVRPSP